MVSVYFLLYLELAATGAAPPARNSLQAFEEARRVRYDNDEEELSAAQRRLLEFDRLSQSPNDQSALKFRLQVLKDYLADPAVFSA